MFVRNTKLSEELILQKRESSLRLAEGRAKFLGSDHKQSGRSSLRGRTTALHEGQDFIIWDVALLSAETRMHRQCTQQIFPELHRPSTILALQDIEQKHLCSVAPKNHLNLRVDTRHLERGQSLWGHVPWNEFSTHSSWVLRPLTVDITSPVSSLG